jgi:hypothetical protein
MAKKNNDLKTLIIDDRILNKIYLIRGEKVMLDRDLAEMYQVETRALNQAIKRNINRFPKDFMFQLNEKEFQHLISQIVISSAGQNKNWGGIRKLPLAFTEQGVAMLSSVLNSEVAIDVNIRIIRVFTKMRNMVSTNKEILLQLNLLEKETKKNSKNIDAIFEVLKELIHKHTTIKRGPIGFKIKSNSILTAKK